MSSQAARNHFIHVPRAALVASVILHLMVPVSFVTVRTLEYFGFKIFPRTHVKDVYQEYVQVDLVGLPDIAIKDLEKLDPTLPEVETPAKEVEPQEAVEDDLMALEAQKKAIAEKEKAEREDKTRKAKAAEEEKKRALKQIEEELRREQALKALAQNEGKKGRTKLKGNLISKGTAVVGNLGTPKDQYTSIVMQKIREKFYIMPTQRDRGLNNTVHLELYPNGRVRSKSLVRSSSDSLFDSAVLQAIEDAQPLPIPEDLSLIQGGLSVTFRAEE